KAKGLFRRSVNARDDVARDNFAFARSMLRRRRTIFACRWIWNERAITECPQAIHTFYFQVRIDFDSPAFFLAWNTIKDRIRRDACSPDQCRANDRLAIAQLDFIRTYGGYFAVRTYLHSTFAKFLVGVHTEFLAQLGQDVLARMHENESEHFFFEIWVEWERVTQKIVDTCDRLDACKSAAGYNKGQQRRAFSSRTFSVGFFQMGD